MPYFTKDLKKARKPINARSETVATSEIFRAAFAKRRCLVPAAAYYDGATIPMGSGPIDKAGQAKSPKVLNSESLRKTLGHCGDGPRPFCYL